MARREDNLKPGGYKLTLDDQKKGGIASAEARNAKKDLKNIINMLLEKDVKLDDGKIVSGGMAISIKQFQKAMQGDTKAFEVLRDTAGQKPADKIEITEWDNKTAEAIEDYVE